MNSIFDAVKNLSVSLFLITIGVFIKRDKKKWAFGSWIGNAFSDNSKYLLLTALKQLPEEGYTLYWVGNEKIKADLPKDKRVRFLKLNSFSSALKLLSCKYFFCSQFPGGDLCKYNVFTGATVIYLHHGIPIKKIGTDVNNNKVKTGGIQNCLRRISGAYRKFDYILASSPLNAEASTSGYGYLGVTMANNLCIGYPRNDYLTANKDNQDEIGRVKKYFADMFHYDKARKVILYLPTFRWDIDKTPSLFFADAEVKRRLQKLLQENNAVLIEKSHNRLIRRGIKTTASVLSEDNMIFISSMVDTQELLLSSDMLITDYSGCMLDYLLIDRPIINYVPDYEFYRDQDAGLLYELEDFSSGDTPRDFNGLLLSLEKFFQGTDEYSKKRKRNRDRFLSYENGDAGVKLCDICTGKASFEQYCLLK